MAKAIEISKVRRILSKYQIHLEFSGGKHPAKFVKDNISYPVKYHGEKTMIQPYALKWIIKRFNLPEDIFY